MATARLKAKGQYAYLRYGSQQDSVITFPVNAGLGRIYLVFDTFFYDMPTGLDTAVIAVDVDGFKDTARVRLACEVLVDHLEIETTDTVQYGGTGDLKVIASNADGEEVYLDGSAQIDLFSYPETVNFLTTNGDTVPSPLLRVPYDDVRQGKIRLIANGLLEGGGLQEAEVSANVRRDYVFGYGTFNIEVGCLRVFADPDTVAVADTATLAFRYSITDTTFGDFLQDQLFEVTLAADSSQGLLLSEEGGAATTLLGKAQPIRYIAPPAIEGDLLLAHIVAAPTTQTGDGGGGGGGVARAGAGQGSEKTQDSHAQGYQLALAELQACALQYVPVMGEEDFEILLGESKYYYVVEKDGKRRIKETTEPEFPEKEEGETIIESASVWGDNPVTVTGEEANIGKRLGVYWETEKPRPDTPKSKLLPGLIRLVGRYWTADSVYKVKLTANSEDAVADVVIGVKKPSELGSLNNRARDVHDVEYNLDDLLMEFGGKYGLPPHVLKAQVWLESKFGPAYRWEPFLDAVTPQEKFTENRYRIQSEDNVGSPDIPDDHRNIFPPGTAYHGYQGTIWDLFFAYSSNLNKDIEYGDRNDLYPSINRRGVRLWYVSAWEGWIGALRRAYNNSSAEDIISGVAFEAARDAANEWLKYNYNGGILNRGVAQTRIAASFGILQLTYTTAVLARSYPHDDKHLPETINNQDTVLTYAVPYLNDQLTNEKVDQHDDQNNWHLGFEETLRLALNRFNGRRDSNDYGSTVLTRAAKYAPKKP